MTATFQHDVQFTACYKNNLTGTGRCNHIHTINRYRLGAMVIGHDRPFYAPSRWYIVAYASYSVRILGDDW